VLSLSGIAVLVVARIVSRDPRPSGLVATGRLVTAQLAMFFVGAGLITALFVLPLVDYITLTSRLARGHFTTVEGVITNFVPAGPGGHPNESWVVTDKGIRYRYGYSHSDLTAAYTGAVTQGGPLRGGMSVRVADVDGEIARLEVAE
jgi:hypothetical protein